MSPLTHRERVLAVIDREVPDRYPVDLGGSPASGINLYAYKRLKHYLGLPGPIRVQTERSLLAWPDDAILELFDVDLRLVIAHTAEDSGTRGIFDELTYATEAEYTDIWGVTRRRPPGGHYYVVRSPFEKEDLSLADLDAHPWPKPTQADVTGLRTEAERLRRETDCALVVHVPGRLFSLGQFLWGFANWLVQLKANPEFCEALLDRGLEIQLAMAEATLEAVGDMVDAIVVLVEDAHKRIEADGGKRPREEIIIEGAKELALPMGTAVVTGVGQSGTLDGATFRVGIKGIASWWRPAAARTLPA